MGFAPTAVSLLSKVRTVAIWLGCRTAEIAVTLDTWKEYRGSSLFQMVPRYCEEIDAAGTEDDLGAAGKAGVDAKHFQEALKAKS